MLAIVCIWLLSQACLNGASHPAEKPLRRVESTVTPVAIPSPTLATPKTVVALSEPMSGRVYAQPVVEPPPLPPTQLSEYGMIGVMALAGWPRDLWDVGLALAWCESKWNVNAVGDGGKALSLFQTHAWDRAWAPLYAGRDPFDPVVAAEVALRIYEIRGRWGGAGGWTCADLLGIY